MKTLDFTLSIQAKINAMNSSVAAINRIATGKIKNDDLMDAVMRNVIHLQGMLQKAEIQNHSCSKAPFQASIAQGNAFLVS